MRDVRMLITKQQRTHRAINTSSFECVEDRIVNDNKTIRKNNLPLLKLEPTQHSRTPGLLFVYSVRVCTFAYVSNDFQFHLTPATT